MHTTCSLSILLKSHHATDKDRSTSTTCSSSSSSSSNYNSDACIGHYAATTTITGVEYYANERPWCHCGTLDMAVPCATQNEVDEADADAIVAAGAKLVVEGANMPCTPNAIAFFHASKVVFGPAKAVNAGTRGLEDAICREHFLGNVVPLAAIAVLCFGTVLSVFF